MKLAALPINALLSRLKSRQPRVVLALNELQSAAGVATRFPTTPTTVSKALASGEPLMPEQGCNVYWHGRPQLGQVSSELAQA